MPQQIDLDAKITIAPDVVNPISFLKGFDRLLAPPLASLLPPAKAATINTPRHICVIRPGGIGDAVLLVPAIQALRTKYPEASLTVLAEKRNAGVFSLSPVVDTLLLYDCPTDLFRLFGHPFDLIIDTEQYHRLSAILCRLLRPRYSIGFAGNLQRQHLFSTTVPYCHDRYEIESFFQLLQPLGSEVPPSPAPFLHPPLAVQNKARELTSDLRHPYVTIFPGASIAERRWGSENFRTVCRQLNEAGSAVVVVGGPEDCVQGKEITAGQSTARNLAGRTTLAETAAVIARSALLVSGDSGILHIGVGLGIPTVSLFGPGIAAKWAPRGENHIVINKNLPCSPCTRFGTTPPCPHNVRCLKKITPEEVSGAALALLSHQTAR